MERDCFKISLCILPTGINPTSIISLSRPECWKNYSLFNFKPLETGTFSLFTLFANLKLVKITKSAKGQYLWANAIVSAICDTHEWVCDAMIALNQHSCPHFKTTVFMVINHIFCDISFRIVYMFTREKSPSSRWATEAILPVTKK